MGCGKKKKSKPSKKPVKTPSPEFVMKGEGLGFIISYKDSNPLCKYLYGILSYSKDRLKPILLLRIDSLTKYLVEYREYLRQEEIRKINDYNNQPEILITSAFQQTLIDNVEFFGKLPAAVGDTFEDFAEFTDGIAEGVSIANGIVEEHGGAIVESAVNTANNVTENVFSEPIIIGGVIFGGLLLFGQ